MYDKTSRVGVMKRQAICIYVLTPVKINKQATQLMDHNILFTVDSCFETCGNGTWNTDICACDCQSGNYGMAYSY